MRTLTACVVLAISAGFLTARDDEWTEFKPKGGKLVVKMPSKPKDISRDIDIVGGKVKANIYACEVGPTGAFLVSWTDFPDGLIDQNNITTHIDGVQGGVVGSGKGKVISTKNIKIQKKYVGRDVTYTVPNINGTGKVRIFFVGDRLYQIMALGDDKFMKSDDIDTYFDSFELSK